MSVTRYHIEQLRCDTCVATCAAIVLGRLRGLSPPQIEALAQEIVQQHNADAKLLDVIAVYLETKGLGPQKVILADPDHPGNISYLADNFAFGAWWMIALMHPGPMRRLHAELVPPPSPQHGFLPEFGLLHAVVLVDATPDIFLCLDPWLARAYQPIPLTWDRFSEAWAGLYLPVRIIP